MTFKKINADITAAMKASDKLRLETLRMMKSKILIVNARGDLPESETVKILQNYAKSLKESIDIMEQHGKAEEAGKVTKELSVVEEYLPVMLSEEEAGKLVRQAINDLGITSIKEIGRVMKETVGKRQDLDGSMVRKIVSEILQ